MKVFPLSLADDANELWISKGDGKITTLEELVEKFFCRFYPESYDGEDEIDFDPFLDLDSLDVADMEIPQSIRKGNETETNNVTDVEDEIARGVGNETETNNATDVEEGSDSEKGNDSKHGSYSESSDGNNSDENPVEHVHVDMDTFDKSNADTLGDKDKHGEFNANEEMDVDLDVIDNEEFESASDEDRVDRVRQRKLKQLKKQNKPIKW
ncbi:hypothetical protein Tco_0607628 [Tanacetum coccineum]